jgi:small subunit ribosomal protein S20
MPRRKSSLKSQRIDKKRRLRNLRIKQQLKKAFKQFQALVSAKNTAEAKTLLQKIYSQLDKAAKKRIIHPKTANRKKSRLTLKLARSGTKTA